MAHGIDSVLMPEGMHPHHTSSPWYRGWGKEGEDPCEIVDSGCPEQSSLSYSRKKGTQSPYRTTNYDGSHWS